MFKLVIQDDEGKTTIVPLVRDEITIGRKEGNTIRLTERNVSRRHARILRNNGEVHIEDLGSYNGIRVNNARIAERVSLRVSDQVQIGDYKLYLKAEGQEHADEGLTIPLKHGDGQVSPDVMTAVTPLAHAVPVTNGPQIASPNRAHAPVADADPTGHTIGPETAAAVAALTAPSGYGRLVVVSSNFAGREFELSRPQMVIGRTDDNAIVINHRSISRNHARIVREPETGRYTISDLQSSNGVRVNGQDYGKVELRRGDVIDLGHVRLRFVDVGEDFVFARDAVITDVTEVGSKRGMLVALLAAVVVLVAGVVIYSLRESGPEDTVVVPPENSGSVTPEPGEPVIAASPPEPVADPTTPAPTQTPTPSVAKSDDVKTQIGKCTELATQRAWQALEDCATNLSALGNKDKASEFHEKARQETANEHKNAEVARAIKEGNLKAAQAALKDIGDDSVYFKAASETFTRAENQAVEAARRTAQGYLNARDCLALRRFHGQQKDSTTERVAAAVWALVGRCAPATSEPNQRATPTNPVATPAPPARNACDAINVDELMEQAATQYQQGYAKTALSLVIKALACRQDGRTYRFAVMYACTAKDLASAKLYFAKAPKDFQANLEQKCQQEGLDVRGP